MAGKERPLSDIEKVCGALEKAAERADDLTQTVDGVVEDLVAGRLRVHLKFQLFPWPGINLVFKRD